MKHIKLFVLFLIITSTQLQASAVENKELLFMQKGIDLTLSEKFSEAKIVFEEIIKRNPNHPIGYFTLGCLYNAMTVHYETDIYNREIYKYYNRTIRLTDSLLEITPHDPWLLFYIGSAKSNNGLIQGREGNLFSAVSSAYGGISYIEKCLKADPDFNDAKMLLGGYMYYKSSWTHWLYDSRDEGIDLIKEAIASSNISSFFAISALTWIYIDYHKPHLALQISEAGLKKYPESRYFLFGKARAFYDLRLFPQAIKEYEKIKRMISTNEVQNNFDRFNCAYRLAFCHYGLKDYKSAKNQISEALNYPLAAKEKKRLHKSISELDKLQNTINNLDN